MSKETLKDSLDEIEFCDLLDELLFPVRDEFIKLQKFRKNLVLYFTKDDVACILENSGRKNFTEEDLWYIGEKLVDAVQNDCEKAILDIYDDLKGGENDKQ